MTEGFFSASTTDLDVHLLANVCWLEQIVRMIQIVSHVIYNMNILYNEEIMHEYCNVSCTCIFMG